MTITAMLLLFALLLLQPCLTAAEIKVGVILPYSGPFAKFGEKIRAGLEAAKPPGDIKLIYEDEGCEAAAAVRAYQKLASLDGVKLFLGPFCGSPQKALAPIIAQRRQVALLGNSVPRALFAASGQRMFSTQPAIETEASFLAKRMNRRGIQSIVAVFFENEFSRAHLNAFSHKFEGEILETIAFSAQDAAAIKAAALRIKKLNPQAVYAPDATPLMLGLIGELSRIRLESIQIYSVYSAQTEEILKLTDPYGDRLIYSYPAIGMMDALEFFPKQAMQILAAATRSCKESADCVVDYMKSHYQFDQFGSLSGELELRTMRNGRAIAARP